MRLKNYDEIMELTGTELVKYAIELNKVLNKDSEKLRAYELEKIKNKGYFFGLIGKKETKEPVYENPNVEYAFFFMQSSLREETYLFKTKALIELEEGISKALDISLINGDIKQITARALLMKRVVYFSDSRTKKQIFENSIDKK